MTELAKQIRRDTIRMIRHAGSGHIGGALGAADILAALYDGILRFHPENPSWKERDRLVLSNGHICAAWYSVLARTGQLPIEELATHRRFGSRLQGHPARAKLGDLVETSSGPLGQGLSVANGLALAARLDTLDSRVFCILGDGELAEGQVWEAAMTSGHYKLDRLTAIVLVNGLQIDGATRDVMTQEPIGERFSAFGWRVHEIDGHDDTAVAETLKTAVGGGKPHVIVASVKMASGVPVWEDHAKWHGATPSVEASNEALQHLGVAEGYKDFPLPADSEVM